MTRKPPDRAMRMPYQNMHIVHWLSVKRSNCTSISPTILTGFRPFIARSDKRGSGGIIPPGGGYEITKGAKPPCPRSGVPAVGRRGSIDGMIT